MMNKHTEIFLNKLKEKYTKEGNSLCFIDPDKFIQGYKVAIRCRKTTTGVKVIVDGRYFSEQFTSREMILEDVKCDLSLRSINPLDWIKFEKRKSERNDKTKFLVNEVTSTKNIRDIFLKVILRTDKYFNNPIRIKTFLPQREIDFEDICLVQLSSIGKVVLKTNYQKELTLHVNKIENNKQGNLGLFTKDYTTSQFMLGTDTIKKKINLNQLNSKFANTSRTPQVDEHQFVPLEKREIQRTDFLPISQKYLPNPLKLNSDRPKFNLVFANTTNGLYISDISSLRFPLLSLRNKKKSEQKYFATSKFNQEKDLSPLPIISLMQIKTITHKEIPQITSDPIKVGTKRKHSEMIKHTKAKFSIIPIMINVKSIKTKVSSNSSIVFDNIVDTLETHEIKLISIDQKYNEGVDVIMDMNTALILVNVSDLIDEYDSSEYERISETIDVSYLKYKKFLVLMFCNDIRRIAKGRADIPRKLERTLEVFLNEKFAVIRKQLGLEIKIILMNDFLDIVSFIHKEIDDLKKSNKGNLFRLNEKDLSLKVITALFNIKDIEKSFKSKQFNMMESLILRNFRSDMDALSNFADVLVKKYERFNILISKDSIIKDVSSNN